MFGFGRLRPLASLLIAKTKMLKAQNYNVNIQKQRQQSTSVHKAAYDASVDFVHFL